MIAKGKQIACIVLLTVLALACAGGERAAVAPIGAASPAPIGTSAPTETPTATPAPSDTPEPTETPSPTETPMPTERPAPELRLIGDAKMTVDAAFYFTDPGAIAKDADGNDISDRVTVSGEVVPYARGTYTLTYRVTDAGKTETAVRTVTVKPVDMPEIEQPPEKTVYLTFDDGPCGNTERLLDTLKKYDVKATFFVVGTMGHKDLIARAYAEGHTIGVHSYTHEYHEIYASEQAFFEDFLATQAVIYAQTGTYARIFRFPGGSGNSASLFNSGIMTRLIQYMEDMGYRHFDWNVSSGDASAVPRTTEEILQAMYSGISAHPDYAVVLQHDIKINSVLAVEKIIEWGLDRGYSFRALDLSSPVVHTRPMN